MYVQGSLIRYILHSRLRRDQIRFLIPKIRHLILAEQVCLRIQKNPRKSNYLYLLTKKGFLEKTKLTLHFMERKMTEYDELKKEIESDKKNVDRN